MLRSSETRRSQAIQQLGQCFVAREEKEDVFVIRVEAYLESIKLHVGIAMCKTLDHGGNHIFRPVA